MMEHEKRAIEQVGKTKVGNGAKEAEVAQGTGKGRRLRELVTWFLICIHSYFYLLISKLSPISSFYDILNLFLKVSSAVSRFKFTIHTTDNLNYSACLLVTEFQSYCD